ncbi:hypothetical protein BJ170DRAFT_125201 [Xylariales sp. AK1849]|nr:hypothetical protein BJ170DRAFT_125201 [Xylariales sp. AK1849]
MTINALCPACSFHPLNKGASKRPKRNLLRPRCEAHLSRQIRKLTLRAPEREDFYLGLYHPSFNQPFSYILQTVTFVLSTSLPGGSYTNGEEAMPEEVLSGAPATDPNGDDGSNWTLMYVVLALIPVMFAGVALFANWKERRIKADTDIEAVNTTYRSIWFPWREAMAQSESAALPAPPPPPPPAPRPFVFGQSQRLPLAQGRHGEHSSGSAVPSHAGGHHHPQGWG